MWPTSQYEQEALSLAVQGIATVAGAGCGTATWPGHPTGPYPGYVTELPIDDAAGLANAAHDAAERGQVVYLTDPQGRRIAAIVPASVAAAGTAAIEALEDTADLAVAEEALAEWDTDERRTYRLADVDAELSES
jgi:hypothetical protein